MRRLFLLPFLFLFLPGISFSQQVSRSYDEAYGLNPKLFNGEIYNYFLAPDTKGNQYFKGQEFTDGSVRIKGVTYDHILLNYDVFNQQLLLKYDYPEGTGHILSLSRAWLQSFTLAGANFELIRFQDTSSRIFQVQGTGKVRLLTSWYKEQKIDYYYTAPYFVFLPLKKEMYLQMDSGMKHFYNNKSFLLAFNPAEQAAIRKYLRQNNINTRKAGAAALLQLIQFCNTLPE